MNNKNKNLYLLPIALTVFMGAAWLKATAGTPVAPTKPEDVIELGYPAVGKLSSNDEEKMQLAIYKGVVLVLRPDGSVGWKLSPALRERFDKDMKAGQPTPSFFKTTLIPAK